MIETILYGYDCLLGVWAETERKGTADEMGIEVIVCEIDTCTDLVLLKGVSRGSEICPRAMIILINSAINLTTHQLLDKYGVIINTNFPTAIRFIRARIRAAVRALLASLANGTT